MDQVVAERAFEPFFTTKGGDATAGLGLSAVRRFAAGTGGKAWLTSKPGYGTTVTILLPAAQSAEGIVPHQGYPGARASAGTIVVVDDEPTIRDVAHRVLTAAGYHVTTAANGLETLTLLADPAVAADLVLADVVMPGITAQDFLARLRQLRPGIKVLFMSGYERPDEAAGLAGTGDRGDREAVLPVGPADADHPGDVVDDDGDHDLVVGPGPDRFASMPADAVPSDACLLTMARSGARTSRATAGTPPCSNSSDSSTATAPISSSS